MKDYGLVSIITPTWECANYISQTIYSIQAQTYKNWELLIQDDSSTDNTDRVVELIAQLDPRIKYECNPKNFGAAVTRNNALKRAQGRWIAFVDSDDLWEPEKLEKQLRFMVENGYKFSYTCYQEIDNRSKEIGVVISGPKHISKFGMFAFCWPGCLTVMYDFKTVGLLQIEDIKKNNDYAMWLKVCQKADCHLLDDVLAKYRRNRLGSISTHSYITLIKWHYKLFRVAEKCNPISSLIHTIVNLLCGIYKKVVYVKHKLQL